MLISVTGDYPDTQSHDAEMLRFGSDLTFIESTHGGSCDGGFITNKSGGFSAAHATVLLAHQYGRLIMNGDGIDEEWCDECAFELNDAVDTSGAENRDLYLAFNRLVQNEVPGAGDGYGVCSAKLSWVCNVANP